MNEGVTAIKKAFEVRDADEPRAFELRPAARKLFAVALPSAVIAFAMLSVRSAEVVAFSPELVLIAVALLFPLAPKRLSTNRYLALGAVAAILTSAALVVIMLAADIFAPGGLEFMGATSLTVAGGTLRVDAFSLVFDLIFLGAGLFVAIASITPELERSTYQGIYFMLLMLTLVGTMVVASAASLITVFLGLELAGISTYAMVAFPKSNKLSSEAAMKYYIIGSTSTALVLFGLSYLYGITGSLDIATISQRLQGVPSGDSGVVLALAFLVAGFGFKMAAVPFHLWAPDTYTGAASPVSALLAAGTKKMGFAAAFKVIVVGMIAARAEWSALFAVLAIFTMTVGNAAAVKQTNLKRLFAYSSIAQAGYILAALAIVGAGGHAGMTAAAAGIFHSMTHMVMKAGAFILLGALIARQVGDDLDDLRGLRWRSPHVCFVMALILFSLVGMPLLAGFWSKYYIAVAGIEAGSWYPWLVLAVLLNSAFSLYYYVRVLRTMWFEGEKDEAPPIEIPFHFWVVMAMVVAFIVFVGLFPEPFFQLSIQAAQALLGGLPGY
jgi:proton-translocating NADH-quinone oxidoreductase chain N